MIKITREVLLDYIETAKKEEAHVSEHIKRCSSRGEKINTAILKRRYVITHLLPRLLELERSNDPVVFIDFKDEETINEYKTYLDYEDGTLNMLKKGK